MSHAFRIVLVAAAALAGAAVARASDPAAFSDLKKRYEKAAKNHDDNGVRERRKLILECFDYLDQKECRKLLRDSLDGSDDSVPSSVDVQLEALVSLLTEALSAPADTFQNRIR